MHTWSPVKPPNVGDVFYKQNNPTDKFIITEVGMLPSVEEITICHKNELILSRREQERLFTATAAIRDGLNLNYQLNFEERKNMKQLYQLIVVTKKKDIIIDEKIVASNIEEAKFDLSVHEQIKLKGLSLGDVTVIVNVLGSVAVEAE